MREKLIEILMEDIPCNAKTCLDCELLNTDGCKNKCRQILADHLIANGVTIQKYGRWVHRKNWDFFVCSECSHQFSDTSNYCPNCGARMDGDSNG